MSALDSLPSNRPIELLRNTKQTAQEIKAAQARGSTGVVMSRIYSGNAWDFTLSSPGTVEILFTSDNDQFGGAFCYRLYAHRNDDSYGTRDLSPVLIERRPNVGVKQRWTISLPFIPEGTTRLKFYFLAQGPGTFTVKKL